MAAETLNRSQTGKRKDSRADHFYGLLRGAMLLVLDSSLDSPSLFRETRSEEAVKRSTTMRKNMPASNAFLPMPPHRADPLAEALYPDIFSPPPSPAGPHSTQAAQGEMAQVRPQGGPTQQRAVPVRSMQETATAPSLIAALQSTMQETKRSRVVIPGAQTRRPRASHLPQARAERRVAPLLRLAFLLLVMLLLLLATL